VQVASVVVCIPTCNELARRGELVLRRSLDSLRRSRDYLHARRPEVAVRVSVCDDASDDDTPAFVKDYLADWPEFALVRHAASLGAGPARNAAAAQFKSDVVCFLDADDQYHDRHLFVGVSALEQARGADGRPYAALSTSAVVSESVHPEWEARISRTIPITKFVRRAAWEFVEGMPTLAVYRILTCEDQFLIRKLGMFFELLFLQERTATYWNYPGSSLARQLAKFRRSPREYDPTRDDPAEWQGLAQLMARHQMSFLGYLQGKWSDPLFDAEQLPFARRPGVPTTPTSSPQTTVEVNR